MLGRELGVVAASALGASAFLIPAGSAAVEGDLTTSVFDPKNQIVRLPCSACVFPAKVDQEGIENVSSEDETFWIQGGANDVILNLTVSERQSLEINGHAIFPVEDLIGFLAEPIHVLQVPKSASQKEIEDGAVRSMPLEVTGAGVGVGHESQITPMGDILSSIRYSIMELESNLVHLDDVVVDVLKTADGELLIMDARIESGRAMPYPMDEVNSVDHSPAPFPLPGLAMEHTEQTNCGRIPISICRLVKTIESKVAHFTSLAPGRKPGCGRRPHQLPGHIKPEFLRGGAVSQVEAEDNSSPHHPFSGRPHHHHKHHGHHHHHSFFRSLALGFVAVVIPTLAGVAVGMFISVLGLIVGRLIGFVWIKFVRGGRQGYDCIVLEEPPMENEADVVEKRIILGETDQDAPPIYEEAPAYEEHKTAP